MLAGIVPNKEYILPTVSVLKFYCSSVCFHEIDMTLDNISPSWTARVFKIGHEDIRTAI